MNELPAHWKCDDGDNASSTNIGGVQIGTLERYVRSDGAVVLNGWRSHHDPSKPGSAARLYMAFPPDSDLYLSMRRPHSMFLVPRRWSSAVAAMRALDREHPLKP